MKLSISWPTYGNTTVVLPYSLSLSLSPTLPHLRRRVLSSVNAPSTCHMCSDLFSAAIPQMLFTFSATASPTSSLHPKHSTIHFPVISAPPHCSCHIQTYLALSFTILSFHTLEIPISQYFIFSTKSLLVCSLFHTLILVTFPSTHFSHHMYSHHLTPSEVARSIPALAKTAPIYTMPEALMGYCPWGWGVRPVNWIYRLWRYCP